MKNFGIDGCSRGMRNCNPGNIVANAIKWRGSIGSDGRFVVFSDFPRGVRAMFKIFYVYMRRYRCRTPSDFVRRWSLTDVDTYIRFVNCLIGEDWRVSPEMPGDFIFDRFCELCAAIIYFENDRHSCQLFVEYHRKRVTSNSAYRLGGDLYDDLLAVVNYLALYFFRFEFVSD